MKDKKRPYRLWDASIRLLVFILFPYSSLIPESFKMKMAWSDVSMVWPRKPKSLLSPFYTWVFTGDPISITRAHRATTFVAQYPPTLEIECTIEL